MQENLPNMRVIAIISVITHNENKVFWYTLQQNTHNKKLGQDL